MKIFTPVGSSQRLVEMFGRINKVQFKEGFALENDSINTLNDSFNKLKNGQITIKQPQTQVNGDKTFIELKCADERNNNITFNFQTSSQESDQDGVFSVGDVRLINFKFEPTDGSQGVEMDENSLNTFNQQHSDELYDIVDEYIDVESENQLDELYEEAIKKIDSYPYGGGSERTQTAKNYVGEKPSNPKLRTNAPELEKYIDENEEHREKTKYDYIHLNPPKGSSLYDNADDWTRDLNLYYSNNYYKTEIPHKHEIDGIFNYSSNGKKIASFDNRNDIGWINKLFSDNKIVENIDVEQLTQDKEENGDMLDGGLGDDASPLDFNPEQILQGMKVEFEHTNDPMVALEITMDHLSENSDYYSYLDKMEKEMDSDTEPDQDDELTDMLLGYKPKNVGDEIE